MAINTEKVGKKISEIFTIAFATAAIQATTKVEWKRGRENKCVSYMAEGGVGVGCGGGGGGKLTFSICLTLLFTTLHFNAFHFNWLHEEQIFVFFFFLSSTATRFTSFLFCFCTLF